MCSTVARLLIAGGEISNSIIPDPTCIANLLAFGASCNVSLDVSDLYWCLACFYTLHHAFMLCMYVWFVVSATCM